MTPLQGPHRSWPLSPEALWASLLDCQALGDWGAGVNRVSGSWTCVCHRPMGDTEEVQHALGWENRKATGLAGWGMRVPSIPAHPLQSARPQYPQPGQAISVQPG